MSRLHNIPPLQSVTEAGATSDQATAFSGGLASTLPAVSNLTVTSSVILGGTPSFSVLVANNVLDSLVHIGTGNTLATYLQLQSAFDNDWVIIGNDNTQGASGPTSNVVSIGSSNILYSNNLVSVGNSNTIGVSGVGNDASTIVNFGNTNNYDADSSSNICVGYGNDFQGSLATGSMVIGGSGNTIANNGVLLFGLSGYTTAHNNCTIIGGGGTNPPASTAQGEFIFGSTTARYILPGFIPDDKYLYFGASSGVYSRIYRDSGTTNLVIEPDGGTATGKVSISGAYTLPNADGSTNHVLKTDGAGALGFAAATTLVPPGGSTTQIQYNNAGAFGGMSNFTFDGSNIDFTSGDMRFDDNVDLVFGTGDDAKIYYNGTDLIINPTLVGSGDLLVGPTANQDLRCNFLGLAGSAISANAVVNCSTSGSARGCLAFSYTKTGGTNIVANINSTVNYQLTTNANAVGVSSTVSEQVSNTGNSNYRCYSAAWNSTVNITTGTHIFKGIELDGGNGPASASGATVIQVGVHVLPMASFTSATNTRIGGIFEHDLMVTDNTKVVFEGVGGTTYTVGDTYMVYSSSASELQTFVNGNELITLTSTALGFFAVAPQARPAAYTQTYSTATRTHNNVTSSSVATTAATNVAPFGYTTAAQADAIPVAINAVAADLLNLKQLVNQMLDDLQGYGLLQ